MQSYEHYITVQHSDIDAMNHVNNVVYVQWVQDAASAHWNALAPPEVKGKYNWVVLRHEIDYRNAAVLNDRLVARTWVQDYEGVRSTRIVKIFREQDNKVLVEARTIWCLLSAANNRPTRVGDDIKNIFSPPDF
ncbi:thioesterase family protein [Chryseolinea sp. T2]|uniref:acyl-CoA thioesterase n=1 Tax=Chryseolinea sp. T2 TaxID=3129255 RepID=UPI0030771F0B